MIRKIIWLGLVLFASATQAQPNYKPSQSNLAYRQTFQDMKFAIYSLGNIQRIRRWRMGNVQQKNTLR